SAGRIGRTDHSCLSAAAFAQQGGTPPGGAGYARQGDRRCLLCLTCPGLLMVGAFSAWDQMKPRTRSTRRRCRISPTPPALSLEAHRYRDALVRLHTLAPCPPRLLTAAIALSILSNCS